MKNVIFLSLSLGLGLMVVAQLHAADRPRITGIDHVAFYTTAPDGVQKLYTQTLGLASAAAIESGETVRYMAGKQWIGYSPAPDPKATDRMDHVAFTTENIVALRRYLIEKGVKPSQIEGKSDHSLSFMTRDPEGHKIEFVERGKGRGPPSARISRFASPDPRRIPRL